MRTALVAIFAVACVLSAQVKGQSCGKEGQVCPEDKCCMLSGGARHGTPSCQPLRLSGDSCRPNGEPKNYTLSSSPYDPGDLYTNVYWAVCPCQTGLQCDAGTCA